MRESSACIRSLPGVEIFDSGASEDARVEWNASGGRDNLMLMFGRRLSRLFPGGQSIRRAREAELSLSLKPPGIVRARWTLATDGRASP